MGKGDSQGIDAAFQLLCVKVARVNYAPRRRIAAADDAANQPAARRVMDDLPEFLDVGRVQRLQADKGAAMVVRGDFLQDARLAGMGAQRPFAVDGFAEGRDLFDEGVVLRQFDRDDEQVNVVARGKGGGIVAVIRHAVFFRRFLRGCHAAGGEPLDGKVVRELLQRRVMRHRRPAAISA